MEVVTFFLHTVQKKVNASTHRRRAPAQLLCVLRASKVFPSLSQHFGTQDTFLRPREPQNRAQVGGLTQSGCKFRSYGIDVRCVSISMDIHQLRLVFVVTVQYLALQIAADVHWAEGGVGE